MTGSPRFAECPDAAILSHRDSAATIKDADRFARIAGGLLVASGSHSAKLNPKSYGHLGSGSQKISQEF